MDTQRADDTTTTTATAKPERRQLLDPETCPHAAYLAEGQWPPRHCPDCGAQMWDGGD